MIETHNGGLDAYLAKLGLAMRHAGESTESIHVTIVNAPFSDKLMTTHLGLGVIVLLLNNPKTNTVDRIALSDTFHAKGAINMSSKPFKEIKIPNTDEENIIVKAIREQRSQFTADWKDLFTPALPAEDARFNQAGAGIECSFVYPLKGLKDGGALIFSYFIVREKMTESHRRFMRVYSELATSTLNTV